MPERRRIFESGSFTDNGAHVGERSIRTAGDLVNGTAGCIDAAPGDLFRVGGDVLGRSIQNLFWNTLRRRRNAVPWPNRLLQLIDVRPRPARDPLRRQSTIP